MSTDGQRTPEEVQQLLGLIKSDTSTMVYLPTEEQRRPTRVTSAIRSLIRLTQERVEYQRPQTVISPEAYAKAQDLLGKPGQALTEAEVWEAAEIECEQQGITLVEVYNQVMLGTTRREP